jgi:hypothetical protein
MSLKKACILLLITVPIRQWAMESTTVTIISSDQDTELTELKKELFAGAKKKTLNFKERQESWNQDLRDLRRDLRIFQEKLEIKRQQNQQFFASLDETLKGVGVPKAPNRNQSPLFSGKVLTTIAASYFIALYLLNKVIVRPDITNSIILLKQLLSEANQPKDHVHLKILLMRHSLTLSNIQIDALCSVANTPQFIPLVESYIQKLEEINVPGFWNGLKKSFVRIKLGVQTDFLKMNHWLKQRYNAYMKAV